ncbi:MAG: trypsin-like serine protease [Myxococcota bacterium]
MSAVRWFAERCALAAFASLLACACSASSEIEEIGASARGIIGGELAAAEAWPSVVLLDSGCTGVIVHEEFLISAQHCPAARRAFQVVSDSPDVAPSGELSIVGCEEFPGGGIATGRDLRVCRFRPKLPAIATVPIALGCEMERVRAGASAILVGYGTTSREQMQTGAKRWVSAPIISIGEELEIGDETAGTCVGDSGGPAFYRLDDGSSEPVWRLIGLLSSGYKDRCDVGFYTDLSRVVPWLEVQTQRDLSPCFNANGTWAPTYDCVEANFDVAGVPGPNLRVPATSCGANPSVAVVDSRRPTIGKLSVSESDPGFLDVAAEVHDAESGVRRVEFEFIKADASLVASAVDEIAPYEVRLPTVTGATRVRVTAVDRAGNTSSIEQGLSSEANTEAGCSVSPKFRRRSSGSALLVILAGLLVAVARRARTRYRQVPPQGWR